MKAITVWQPWAQLLVDGHKHIETRPWATSYRGVILIHAGKKPFKETVNTMPRTAQELLRKWYEPDGDNRLRVDAHGYLDRHFPEGAIIGKARLTDCFLVELSSREYVRTMEPAELLLGDFSTGRWGWVLEDPVVFPEPIPAAGKQRLWEYDKILRED